MSSPEDTPGRQRTRLTGPGGSGDAAGRQKTRRSGPSAPEGPDDPHATRIHAPSEAGGGAPPAASHPAGGTVAASEPGVGDEIDLSGF